MVKIDQLKKHLDTLQKAQAAVNDAKKAGTSIPDSVVAALKKVREGTKVDAKPNATAPAKAADANKTVAANKTAAATKTDAAAKTPAKTTGPVPKRAMMDLNGKFSASSSWDENWKTPTLDSPRGVHNAKETEGKEQWWEVDMPYDSMYKFSAMTLQKRGDGCCAERIIDAVKFQYSTDGKTFKDYNNGKYVPTGQKPSDPKEAQVKFEIDPPITANKVRILLDKSHSTLGWYTGRFDLWAVKV